jgi:hypothetical protein
MSQSLDVIQAFPEILQDVAAKALLVICDLEDGDGDNVFCGSIPDDDGREGWLIAISPGSSVNRRTAKAIADLVEACKKHGQITETIKREGVEL